MNHDGNTRARVGAGAIVLALGATFPAGHAGASTFDTVYRFCSQADCVDGFDPLPRLVADGAGNLFGVTFYGGANRKGVVYELMRGKNGEYTFVKLYDFCAQANCADGGHPEGSLVVDRKGNLYGTALDGGNGEGEVFKLKPNSGLWQIEILYTFCPIAECADGSDPEAGLTYVGAGTGARYDGTSPLYGTTSGGGDNEAGVAFELRYNAHGWSERVIHSFGASDDGADPEVALAVDAAGSLYGTTTYGGANNSGTVFELSPNKGNWAESVLYDFCSVAGCADGATPSGAVALDLAGNIVGFTQFGGSNCGSECGGVAYELVPDNGVFRETVLYDFCSQAKCSDGNMPVGTPLIDGAGDVFGSTYSGGSQKQQALGGGVAFEISGSLYHVLHDFCEQSDCTDGEYPISGVIFRGSKHLLGTTAGGGDSDAGIVFDIRR